MEPGNLILRHIVPIKILSFSTFRRIVVALRVELINAAPRGQSDEIKILFDLFNSFSRVGMKPTTYRIYSCTFVPIRHDWPLEKK